MDAEGHTEEMIIDEHQELEDIKHKEYQNMIQKVNLDIEYYRSLDSQSDELLEDYVAQFLKNYADEGAEWKTYADLDKTDFHCCRALDNCSTGTYLIQDLDSATGKRLYEYALLHDIE